VSARRLLVGVTAWAPATARTPWVLRYCLGRLLEARSAADGPRFDLLIVDNDCRHPQVRDDLATLARADPSIAVERFEPQLGWAGARNHMIRRLMDGSWERLLMLDQDAGLLDTAWVDRIESLIETEPDLHAYLLLGNRANYLCEARLPASGTEATFTRGFEGGCHVIDRVVPEVVGGYNTRDFPNPYGLHDAELGARLAASGLLRASYGQFCDPVRVPVIHVAGLSGAADPEKRAHLPYQEALGRRFQEIMRGERLFSAFRS
jgi:hypothetical protein